MIDGVTIDDLSDLLLEIFDWYLLQAQEEAEAEGYTHINAWHTLVHVCRRWRTIVFGSPRRLNLHLFFTEGTPIRETLDVWPKTLPIIMWQSGAKPWDLDDIIGVLDHNDRISEINLTSWYIPSLQLVQVLKAMEKPFPALTDLEIRWQNDEEIDQIDVDLDALIISDSFLGRSVPRLQHLYFSRVPFPRLPELLLSATNLVCLYLVEIPYHGHFSPEAMLNCFSALTNLRIFWLRFESRRRLYNDRVLTHPIRPVLPRLKVFNFKGDSWYLEILVAPMTSPLLDSLVIIFFHCSILNNPQLLQFISRTPNVNPPVEAHVNFSAKTVSVSFPGVLPRKLVLGILSPAHSQLLSLACVCSSSYPRLVIPAVERLYLIDNVEPQQDSEDDVEDSDDQWREVLSPFTAVKSLYLSLNLVLRIADTFQVFGETATEVFLLPTLRDLYLEAPPNGAGQEAVIRQFASIGQFVYARRLANQPIAIHWDRVSEEEPEVDDVGGLPVVDDSSEVDVIR